MLLQNKIIDHYEISYIDLVKNITCVKYCSYEEYTNFINSLSPTFNDLISIEVFYKDKYENEF